MEFLNGKNAALAALGLALLAGVGFTKGVDARTPSIVAQATANPDNSNKEKIQDYKMCRNYVSAIRAFNADYGDISKIIPKIPTSDPLYAKVVDIKTQLNDARVSAEKHISDQCPNFKG